MSLLKMFREWATKGSEEEQFKEMWKTKNKQFFSNWSSDCTKEYFLDQAYYMCQLEKKIESLEEEIKSLHITINEIQDEL